MFCWRGADAFLRCCSYPQRSILPAPTLRLDPRHHARQVPQVVLQERTREVLQGDLHRAPHDHLYGVSLLARALKRYHHADPSWEIRWRSTSAPTQKAACERCTSRIVLKDFGNQTWKVRVEVPVREHVV